VCAFSKDLKFLMTISERLMFEMIIFFKIVFLLVLLAGLVAFNAFWGELVVGKLTNLRTDRFNAGKIINTGIRNILKMFNKSTADNFFNDLFLLYFLTVVIIAPVVVLPVMAPFSFWGQLNYGEVLYSKDGLLLFIVLMAMHPLYYLVLSIGQRDNVAKLSSYRIYKQLLTTELPLLVSLLSVFLAFGTFDLHKIIQLQNEYTIGGLPAIGCLIQPIAFLSVIFVVLSKDHSSAYSVIELEKEWIGGIDKGRDLFFILVLRFFNNVHIVIGAMLITAIFLGGYGPIFYTGHLDKIGIVSSQHYIPIIQVSIFLLKTSAVLFIINFAKVIIPKHSNFFLMSISWNRFFIIGLLNLITTVIFIKQGYFKW